MSPCRSRTMASHQPYSRASWAMTRWPARSRPRTGQATGGWQAVLIAVLAQCRLRFLPKVHNEVAVQGLPDVGHEPAAIGVKPTQRQFLGVFGYVSRTCFVDLEPQAGRRPWLRGSGLASTNLAPRGFCCSRSLQIFLGAVSKNQFREKVQSLQANIRLYAVRS